jgi:hypothetical protein
MVIADTGFWLALASRRDRHHAAAVTALDRLGDEPLILTWPVLTETCYLLLDRIGPAAQERFLSSHTRGAFAIADAGIHPPERMAPLMARYRSLPMDAADASLVLLAESLGHGRILSTDRRDVDTYRWKQREPFDNLLR